MKTRSVLCGLCFALTAIVAGATPVVTVGTPGDNLLLTPSKPTPILGGTLLTFDSLSPFASYSTYGAGGVSISSPDGLLVLPYSTQSGPNELFDNSADGSVNLLISVADGTQAVGFGVADSDGSTLSVQALGAGGSLLGPDFLVNLATTESTVNTGNGYYVVSDLNGDIYGLAITAAGGANDSGLALDDVQIAPTPEPASLSLLGTGLAGVLGLGYTRRKQRASGGCDRVLQADLRG